jgi:hypothetical protein
VKSFKGTDDNFRVRMEYEQLKKRINGGEALNLLDNPDTADPVGTRIKEVERTLSELEVSYNGEALSQSKLYNAIDTAKKTGDTVAVEELSNLVDLYNAQRAEIMAAALVDLKE